jgi:putative DNA primase/helicase
VIFKPENIPTELQRSSRWLLWLLCDVQDGDKLRKSCKVPFDPKTGNPASHSDPATWGSYDVAISAHNSRLELRPPKNVVKVHDIRGIGYAFAPPFFGKDYDKCVLDGVIDPDVEEELKRLDTFTEFSQSGTGIHAIGHGEAPKNGHRKDDREIYGHNRFFVVTGNVVPGFDKEIRRFTPAEVEAEFAKVAAGRPKFKPLSAKREELMTRTDFPDASQAVMSLLTVLAYDHNCDAGKIDAEFLKSKLATDTHWNTKWPRLRESHLAKAIQFVKDHPRSEESRSLITNWLDAVKEKPLVYLWKPVLPIGHITTFAGRSSEGKSPVTIDLLARITRGADWPDGQPNTYGPKKAVLMNIEDGLADMIAPRFRLANGVPESLCSVRGVRVQKKDSFHDGLLALDKDIHLLCDLARSIPDLGIIVIDPITQYLGKARMNLDDEIRNVLGPLLPLAEELKIVIVLVAHFNKNGNTTDPLARIQGGNAFVGMARSVYVFSEDKSKDKYAHILSPARSKETSYLYHTEQVSQEIDGVKTDVIKVVWDGVSDTSAETAIEESKESKREITLNQKAAVELKNFLKAGRRDSVTCQSFLKAAGFRVDDLDWQRVRKYAGVKANQEGGKSWWFLPTSAELFEKPPARDDGAPKF